MSFFATEFPACLDVDKANFCAASISWIRGINKSTVLDEADVFELHDDDAWIESSSGETFALKSFEIGGTVVFGVRHELPDLLGRRWRTECVYSRFDKSAFLRVRGQCVAVDPSAKIELPLKPFFITQAIDDGWADFDGALKTNRKPHYLTDIDLALAVDVVLGKASAFLPCVYVSRDDDNSLPLDVEYVARKLAGIAHVVVEPDRNFSFSLMGASARRNPYGGAVGIFRPNGGETHRFFKRPVDVRGSQLADVCVATCNRLMSGLAAQNGWEWQELQEAQSRLLRERALSRTDGDVDAYINQFDTEIQSKDEQIANLKLLLESVRRDQFAELNDSESLLPHGLSKQIGPELFEGEHSDRLRLIVKLAACSEQDQVDERTRAFAVRFVEETQFSGRAVALSSQIKGAAKDGKKAPRLLGSLLSGFGYQKSHSGKHLKFTPPQELFGLPIEVFPSTPSDSQRGGKNRGSEIIRNFGLQNLK